MSESGEPKFFDGELDELLSRLCEGTLAAEELRQLGERIATDAAARRLYLEYLDLHAALGGRQPVGRSRTSRLTPAVRRWMRWSAAAAAAIVLAAVGLHWLAAPRPLTPDGPSDVGGSVRVTEVSGQVELWDAAGQSSRVLAGAALRPGETLRTGSEDAFAVLEFESGTRIELDPAGQLRFADAAEQTKGPRLLLSTGALHGDVKPRPTRQFLTVVTPQAEVSVAGTQFFVSATLPDTTEVETESGSVRLTRLADGRSVEVPAGSYALASSGIDEVEVRPIPEFSTSPRASFQTTAPRGLAFAPDARRLLVLSKTRWTWWDVASGQLLSPGHDLDRDIRDALLSGDARTIVTAHRDGRVRLRNAVTGQERFTLNLDEGKHKHRTLAISHDGARLAAGRAVSGPKSPIRLWNTADGGELSPIPAPTPVHGLALSADGRRLAAATPPHRKRPNPRLLVWDVEAGTRLAALSTPERSLPILVFAPDARRLAGATDLGAVYVWDVESHKCLSSRGVEDGWTRPIKALAFSPDGRLLAVGLADGRVRVWDTIADREVGLLNGGQRQVRALAFAPDGRTLAVTNARGLVTLWDVPEER
ncbi:MAG: FecR domain-containing protein [Gemmataceae bacterium]